MKKLFTFICIIAFCNSSVRAQTGWFPQTSGTSAHLNSVYFTDANKGYVVGLNGTILKTIDGGTTWTTQASGTTNALNSVFFTDSNTGFAVGDGGTILKTTNGGTTWSAKTSGNTFKLNSIYFIDANTGFTVGTGAHGFDNPVGGSFKTVDGGESWIELGYTKYHYWYSTVFFTDANTGYITGSFGLNGIGIIEKTINGGKDWIEKSIEYSFNNQTHHLLYNYGNFIYFTDPNTAYMGSTQGEIVKTINGTETWDIQPSGTTSDLNSIYFTDANTGYVVGFNGTILKTNNSGTTWNAQTSGTTNELVSVFFTDSNSGFAVGGNGTILKTTDGGGDGILPILKVYAKTLTIGAQSNSSQTFELFSNTNWTITINQGWLTASNDIGSGNKTITLTAASNPTAAPRTATVTVSGSNVIPQLITVTQDGTTGFSNNKDITIQIYPTPANKTLYIIGIAKKVNITIFDLYGKVLISKQMIENQIDISSLINGIYIIKFESEHQIQTMKFEINK
jgi:photosystem II stability/assembly factor-like uncharacterized protein